MAAQAKVSGRITSKESLRFARIRRWLVPTIFLCSWLAFALLVLTTGPERTEARLAFFVSFFLAVTLTTTVIFYLIAVTLQFIARLIRRRNRSKRNENQVRIGPIALVALPVGLLVTAAAWFQSLQALTPTNGLILAGILLALEVILVPRRTQA